MSIPFLMICAYHTQGQAHVQGRTVEPLPWEEIRASPAAYAHQVIELLPFMHLYYY